MAYQIHLSKQALKFLHKQPRNQRERIMTAVQNLPNGDTKKLIGNEFYRLRVGDYRVIYDMYYTIIDILKIDNRGDIYKSPHL